MAKFGTSEFSDAKQYEPRDSPLHRLNGIMLMTSLAGGGGACWNVEYAETRSPARRMRFQLVCIARNEVGRIRQRL